MRIFLCASKHNYGKVLGIKEELERSGHTVTPPNGFDESGKEEELQGTGEGEYKAWKADMLRKDKEIIEKNDALLVLNFDKNGQENYIGGATFLEIYRAFDMGKKVYLYNPIPNNMLKDEIVGMDVTVLEGDLSQIGI